MNLKPYAGIYFRDTFSYTDNAQFTSLGTKSPLSDGSGEVAWALAGATTLVTGHLLQSPVQNTSQVGLAVNTALAVVGATSVTVTPGAAIVANQYQGGKLVISAGAGQGYCYLIGSHAAGNSTVNVVFNLAQSESLQVAANSSTVVDLLYNPYAGVIDNPTSPTAAPAGVAISPIVNGQYGLIGTKGVFPCLIEGTPAIGAAVSPSANVAGAVAAAVLGGQAANTATTQPIVGYMVETGVNGKFKLVKFI